MGMPGPAVTPKVGTRRERKLEPVSQSHQGGFHPEDIREFNANEAKKKSYGDELRD